MLLFYQDKNTEKKFFTNNKLVNTYEQWLKEEAKDIKCGVLYQPKKRTYLGNAL